MTRRVLRVLIEVEGQAFDPDDSSPYADSQAELEAVLTSNLKTITSMDAGDVVTLRDTNGNRCGKVEMEDFPGGSPLLPHWTRLSDLALDVEDEFPVSKFLEEAANPIYSLNPKTNEVKRVPEPGGSKTTRPEPTETFNEDAARAFDEGQVAEVPYSEHFSSHEHVAVDPERAEGPSRPRRGGGANVPPPPGDPSMR